MESSTFKDLHLSRNIEKAIEELGFEEYFYGSGVTAVEWSDIIQRYLPEEHLLVRITKPADREQGESREIELVPCGKSMDAVVRELIER